MHNNNAKQPAAFPAPVPDAITLTTPPAGGVANLPPFNDGRLLTKRDVAALLQCSIRTVDSLMRQRKLPFCAITARLVRFRKADVLASLARFQIGGSR